MGLAVASCLLAVACILFTRELGRVAAVWPGNALAVAVLLQRPRREWPVLLGAAIVGCLTANLLVGDQWRVASLLAACNGLEIALCAGLTRMLVGERPNFSRPRDLMIFGATAAATSFGAGLLAAAALTAAGGHAFLATFREWYVADALGLLIVTPALLALSRGQSDDRHRLASLPTALCFLVLAASLALVFGQTSYPLLFLVMPSLVLCAFQLGARGAALGLLLTAVVAVIATLTGYGPAALIRAGLSVRLGILQTFLATMTMVVLPLGAVLAERRRLDRSLRASLDESKRAEQRLRLASQITGIGYWRVDLATGVAEWSDETYRLHGVTRETFAHRAADAIRLFVEEDQAHISETIDAAARTGEPFELSARLQRQDDRAMRWMQTKGEVELDASGKVVAIFGVLRDITDEHLARQRIEESEARFRQLAESATDVVLKVDRNDMIQYVSPSARRYGHEPDSLVGQPGYLLVHPDDLDKLRDLIAELFASGDVDPGRDRTYRVRKADGDYVWMEGNPALVRDDGGAVVAVISQLRDVSERLAATQVIAESEARYRLLTDNATDVIACYGQDGVLTFISPAVTTLLGYDAEDLIGRAISTLLHPDDVKSTMRNFYPLLDPASDLKSVQFEYRAFRKDGTMVWLEAHPRAVRDAVTGEFLEFQDLVRDVSARKQLEADLLTARDAAEAAAAIKAEFMANMSHEIRTPLTAILGFTSLIGARSDLPEEAAYQVKRVAGAGQALLAIVNDILDFSKLEAGLMPVVAKPTSALETLSDALALFEPQAAAKDLKLVFQGAETLPPRVEIDPDRVRQVLLNLIGNAVKFTEAGTVTLTAGYDVPRQRLQISVRDTGAGMDAQQQSKLFQRFSQVDASSTRRHGGTGLGLAICRGLVEAMGGSVEVQSMVGEGSVFTLEIPAAPYASAIDANVANPPAGVVGLRVLVADDNALNRELARSILEPFEVELSVVNDGLEAVELARVVPFDVILLDLRMPRMDGSEAVLRIRSDPGPNQDVPILAFSADFDVERFGEQGARGFDGLVRKPIEVSALLQALADAVAWDPAAEGGRPLDSAEG